MRGGIGDGGVDRRRVEPGLGAARRGRPRACAPCGPRRAAPGPPPRTTSRPRPSPPGPPQPGADAQERPAPGPVALPRVLLAVDPVHLLEAEPAPAQRAVRVWSRTSRSHSDGLVGPRAHQVDVDVDDARSAAHRAGLSPRTSEPSARPDGTVGGSVPLVTPADRRGNLTGVQSDAGASPSRRSAKSASDVDVDVVGRAQAQRVDVDGDHARGRRAVGVVAARVADVADAVGRQAQRPRRWRGTWRRRACARPMTPESEMCSTSTPGPAPTWRISWRRSMSADGAVGVAGHRQAAARPRPAGAPRRARPGSGWFHSGATSTGVERRGAAASTWPSGTPTARRKRVA